MYINPSVLKTLVKTAYKRGCLRFGRSSDWYRISGAYWMVQINVDKTPNPIKAMMVEYAGELPKDGEYMQITAGGAQYEIKESYLSQWNTLTDHKYSIVECKPTKVLLQPDLCTVRLVQRQDNLNLIAVNEICFDLIDDSKREDEEVAPVGPFIRAVDNAIQWESPIG